VTKTQEAAQAAMATSEDVKHLFRGIDDHTAAAIMALKPTVAQLEEAMSRASGAGEIFAGLRPAEGNVARILEMIRELDEAEEPDR